MASGAVAESLLLLTLETPRCFLDDRRSEGPVAATPAACVDDSSRFGARDEGEEEPCRAFVDDRRGLLAALP